MWNHRKLGYRDHKCKTLDPQSSERLRCSNFSSCKYNLAKILRYAPVRYYYSYSLPNQQIFLESQFR